MLGVTVFYVHVARLFLLPLSSVPIRNSMHYPQSPPCIMSCALAVNTVAPPVGARVEGATAHLAYIGFKVPLLVDWGTLVHG